MVEAEHKVLRWLFLFPALLAAILVGMESAALGEDESCPCFSYEEVESIFQSGEQLAAEGGVISCNAEDYTVESNAVVTIWNQDYTTLAEAGVIWYDFDSSHCNYIDTIGNPGVEHNVRWPHPAPKATARACFDIISRVIAKSDTSGICTIYP